MYHSAQEMWMGRYKSRLCAELPHRWDHLSPFFLRFQSRAWMRGAQIAKDAKSVTILEDVLKTRLFFEFLPFFQNTQFLQETNGVQSFFSTPALLLDWKQILVLCSLPTVSWSCKMHLANKLCTTFVLSRQSMQLVLKTPSCRFSTVPSFLTRKYLVQQSNLTSIGCLWQGFFLLAFPKLVFQQWGVSEASVERSHLK